MNLSSKRRARRTNSRPARKAPAARAERMERRLDLAAGSWNPGFLNVYDASGGTPEIHVQIYASKGWGEVADASRRPNPAQILTSVSCGCPTALRFILRGAMPPTRAHAGLKDFSSALAYRNRLMRFAVRIKPVGTAGEASVAFRLDT